MKELKDLVVGDDVLIRGMYHRHYIMKMERLTY